MEIGRSEFLQLAEEERSLSLRYQFLYIFNIIVIALSTLCFLRVASSLPFLLSNEYLARFAEDANLDTKGELFFSEYGIINFSGFTIMFFILYPFILILLGNNIRLANFAAFAKKIWLKVIICWGVFFTIFSTIAILWGT